MYNSISGRTVLGQSCYDGINNAIDDTIDDSIDTA